MRRFDSLTVKLTARLALAIGLVLALGAAVIDLLNRRATAEVAAEELSVVARTLVGSIRHEMLSGRSDHVAALFGAASRAPPVVLVRLYRADGTVAASDPPPSALTADLQPCGREALEAQAGPLDEPRFASAGDGHWRAVFGLANEPSCRQCHAGSSAVNGYVEVMLSTARARAALGHQRWALIGTVAAVGLVLVLAIRWLVQRSVLRRLSAIGAVVERARAGELSSRVADDSPDEVGVLSRRVDEMLLAIAHAQRDAATQREHIEKLATIGRMTAEVVHELRNAIGSASAAAQLLVARSADGPPRREYVLGIRDQMLRLENLLRRLVAFSRGDRGALQETDVNAAVDQAIELFRASMPPGRCDVRRNFAPDLPRVLGSAQLLEQVFLNLFLNSGQARPTGLVLSVSTERLAAGTSSADAAPFASLAAADAIRVRVADNGPGIPPEVRDRAFEGFVTTKTEGTGLGLSFAHRIVTAHGGRIDIDTAPGGGALCTILLPAMAAAATTAGAPDGASVRPGRPAAAAPSSSGLLASRRE